MKKIALSVGAVAFLTPVLYVGVKLIDHHRFGPADIANGKVQFMKHCIDCHGEIGHGDGLAADSFIVSPDDIYSEITNPFGFKSELIYSVMEGDNGQGGNMPAYKHILTESDVNDILEFIRSLH